MRQKGLTLHFVKMKSSYLFIGTLLVAAGMTLVMRWHGAALFIPHCSKAGIVSLELASSIEAAQAIINCWSSSKEGNLIAVAIVNTQIDFLYLLAYGLFFYVCCFLLSERFSTRWSKVLQYLAIASLAAALLDVVENYFLLQTLQYGVDAIHIRITYIAALIKFCLLGIVACTCLLSIPNAFLKSNRIK